MASTAIWRDLELWLCQYLRVELAALSQFVYVDRKDPDRSTAAGSGFFVAVRYDGGVQDSVITESSQLGVRVGGPVSDTNLQKTGDLARLVRALITAAPSPDPGNPIAAVTGFSGPFPIEPVDRPLLYMTCELRTVGVPFV